MDTFWETKSVDPPRELQTGECILSTDLAGLSVADEHASTVNTAPPLSDLMNRDSATPNTGQMERDSPTSGDGTSFAAVPSSPPTPSSLEAPTSGVQTEASSTVSVPSPSCSERSPLDSKLTFPLAPDVVNECAHHATDRYGGCSNIDGLDGIDLLGFMEDTNTDKHLPQTSSSGSRLIDCDNSTVNNPSGEDEQRQPYRHGQIGAFAYQRFVPGSRPITSDNWRSKPGPNSPTAEQGRLLGTAGSKTGSNSPIHPSPIASGGSGSGIYTATHNATRPVSHPSSGYTPSRSPLSPPTNQSIAGFRQQQQQAGVDGGNTHPNSPAARTEAGFADGSSNPAGVVNDSSQSMTTQSSSSGQTRTNADGSTSVSVRLSPDTLGYCFVRPNGERTRLVPVDMLPVALLGIPAREDASGAAERLVELPIPRGVDAEGRSSNMDRLRIAYPLGGNGEGANALMQTFSPTHTHHPNASHPFHPSHSPFSRHSYPPQSHYPSQCTTTTTTTSRPLSLPLPLPLNLPQHQQQQPPPGPQSNQPPPKRAKVYCDKWVHEGVCAFTQQGCKFKHEMPLDTATQHTLGLFHGLPAWFKKRQAELARLQVVQPTQAAAAQTQQTQQVQGQGQFHSGGGGEGGNGGNSGSKGAASVAGWGSFAPADANATHNGSGLVGRGGTSASTRERVMGGSGSGSGGMGRWAMEGGSLFGPRQQQQQQAQHRPQLMQSWRSAPNRNANTNNNAQSQGRDEEGEEQEERQQQQQHKAVLAERKSLRGTATTGFDGAATTAARELATYRFGTGAGGAGHGTLSSRNERGCGADVASGGRFGGGDGLTASGGGGGGGGGCVPRSHTRSTWEQHFAVGTGTGGGRLMADHQQHHHLQQNNQTGSAGFGGRAFSAFPPSQFGPIAPPRLQQLPQQHLDDIMAGLTRQSGEAQDSAEHRHARL
ncbi:hypothetical protein N656DRAFT_797187 [Canariomyces notabilis]|uniref:C3H1-type domain-containing protein n=1 Tax=Canariomyces notabilis TaxID=2074819 RepID=A0AAN6YU07_9PEZI|nr:hypothetical protein N656DRAFT_797187 [Canariomyces arenarius]